MLNVNILPVPTFQDIVRFTDICKGVRREEVSPWPIGDGGHYAWMLDLRVNPYP